MINVGSQIIADIFLSASIYLLIAVSFSLIYYTTKFFHIAHASTISLGAYLTFLLANQFHFPLILSFLVAIILAALMGCCCEFFIYRLLRKRNSEPLMYLIASIGIYVIIQNCISIYFGDNTKIIRISEVSVGYPVLGARLTSIQIITIIISFILFLGVNLFLNISFVGKSIRAVSGNIELSNIFGISSNKTILITFFLGSLIAAIVGILVGMDTNMVPTFGFNLLLDGIVAMIIGGVGSTRGLIAGAFILAIAQHLVGYCFDTKWMSLVSYTVLILFLLWKPLGFSGIQLRKIEV